MRKLFGLCLAAAVSFSLFLCSCNTTKVDVQKARGQYLMTQPVLLIMPVCNLQNTERLCDTLGAYFSVEVPKRIKGNVIYSSNVPGIKDLAVWSNMVKNGDINANEAASMAKTIGCMSVITVQVLEYKQYPPFKLVLIMHWIDAETGNTIGKVYNDVDVSDTKVNYHYRCFSGQGPLKELYEEFQFSEDLYQTASLSPEKFKLFAAAFTCNVMFKAAADESWNLWRVFQSGISRARAQRILERISCFACRHAKFLPGNAEQQDQINCIGLQARGEGMDGFEAKGIGRIDSSAYLRTHGSASSSDAKNASSGQSFKAEMGDALNNLSGLDNNEKLREDAIQNAKAIIKNWTPPTDSQISTILEKMRNERLA